MFRYVFMLLLINTYYSSLGLPVTEKKHKVIANSLTHLSSSCENSFINEQIKNKITECNITVPPFVEKQIECLIFYDINIQLCEAVNASKLTLNEDNTKKLYEAQDVNSLCKDATNWNIKNLTEYPQYQHIQKIFKTPPICLMTCGTDDPLKQEANFFCKYYKWGLDMLKLQSTITKAQTNDTDVFIATQAHVPVLNGEASTDVGEVSKIQLPLNQNEPPVVKPMSEQNITLTTLNVTNDAKLVETNQASTSNVVAPVADKIEAKVPQEAPLLQEPIKKDLENDDQLMSNIDLDQKENGEKTTTKDKNNKQNIDNKDNLEADDYPDSEEAKDSLPDTQGGDDGDDPNLDLKSDLDVKSDLDQKMDKRIETPVSSFNGVISQREFFPNAMPDGFSEDNEDHFFPLFLSAVILVVLLYVLYHNKNKVAKMVLGLIVEGRQPGRRRNSRGHAYRRLDTLEQAMSANTAAPPSKIIY